MFAFWQSIHDWFRFRTVAFKVCFLDFIGVHLKMNQFSIPLDLPVANSHWKLTCIVTPFNTAVSIAVAYQQYFPFFLKWICETANKEWLSILNHKLTVLKLLVYFTANQIVLFGRKREVVAFYHIMILYMHMNCIYIQNFCLWWLN